MKHLSINLLPNALCVLLLLTASAAVQAQSTLELVKERGHLKCQVGSPTPGSFELTIDGQWRGLDVDTCRAVAAAVFGDPDKVEFVSATSAIRFTILNSGEVDMLSRTTTWTISRDTQLGIDFVATNFYSGQAFMLPRHLGVTSPLELKGATVCVLTGTTSEANLSDFSRANGLDIQIAVFEDDPVMNDTYLKEGCDSISFDNTALAGTRSTFDKPGDHVILPQMISKEPLSIAVRHGDNQWADIARWSFYALVAAEELGVTAANAVAMREDPPNANVARLLGVEGDLYRGLGLDPDWSYNIIRLLGNYGEIYERHFGSGGLGVDRAGTQNDLWTRGGLMYSPPFR